MERINYIVDIQESSIGWLGKKLSGSHHGTIGIAEGELTMTDGELTDGQFIVDTRSIKILDIADQDTNEQFAGHLASEDFFASEDYPTATLAFCKVSKKVNANYHINADLTIRGIMQPVEFDAEVGSIDQNTLKASGRLVVDRTRYNMKFRSGRFLKELGDALIDNDFILNVNLTAHAC